MELGLVVALLVLPIAIAAIRVRRRDRRGQARKIPLGGYALTASTVVAAAQTRARSEPLPASIDAYLMSAIAATGTRLPTSPPVPPARLARGSVAPPVRAPTELELEPPPLPPVEPDEFDDDPPTLVTVRPLR